MVDLWVNKVGPYHNPQETYEYYKLPYCKVNFIDPLLPVPCKACIPISLEKSLYYKRVVFTATENRILSMYLEDNRSRPALF
jgi:hypothetical protein